MSTNNNPSAILQGIEKQLDVKALTSLPEVSKKFLGVKVDLSITEARMDDYQKFCKYVGEQSKIITDAVMQLRTTKLLMKADKENIESSEYKRYKAIIDAKLIARAKEVKDLAAVAQKKAAEFQEIHRVFAKRYEANKDQEIGAFQKNTGLTGFDKNQAKQLIDVLGKLPRDCSTMAVALQERVNQIASFGKAVRAALQAAEAKPVAAGSMLKKLPR